jgi:hypothetical protein
MGPEGDIVDSDRRVGVQIESCSYLNHTGHTVALHKGWVSEGEGYTHHCSVLAVPRQPVR